MNAHNPGTDPWQGPYESGDVPQEAGELPPLAEIGDPDDLETCSDVSGIGADLNTADFDEVEPPFETADVPVFAAYGNPAVREAVAVPDSNADAPAETIQQAEAVLPSFCPEQFQEIDLSEAEVAEASVFTDAAVDGLFEQYGDYADRSEPMVGWDHESLILKRDMSDGLLEVFARRTEVSGVITRELMVRHTVGEPVPANSGKWSSYTHHDNEAKTSCIAGIVETDAKGEDHERFEANEQVGPREMEYVGAMARLAEPPVVSGAELYKKVAAGVGQHASWYQAAKMAAIFRVHAERFASHYGEESAVATDPATNTTMTVSTGLVSDFRPAPADARYVTLMLTAPPDAPWVDPIYRELQRMPEDQAYATMTYEMATPSLLHVTGRQGLTRPDGSHYAIEGLGSAPDHISQEALTDLLCALRRPTAVQPPRGGRR